jgi:hypothetical protein
VRWVPDQQGGEWAATITPELGVRLMRRTLSKPYREGDEPREEFQTFVFETDRASQLAIWLSNAKTEIEEGE